MKLKRVLTGRKITGLFTAIAFSVGSGLFLTTLQSAHAQTSPHFVGTWHASVESGARTNLTGFTDQTLRFIVHTTVGGSGARVQLSNVFGTTALTIGSAHLALRSSGASIVPGTDRVLTFNGAPTVNIPAGGMIYSDPVALQVPQLTDLAISLYLPGPAVRPVTGHSFSLTTNYTSPAGNYAAATDMPVGTTACFTIGTRPCITPWYYITRVEVIAPEATSNIVTLGDSITDGDMGNGPSTVDLPNNRWPLVLANRLLAQKGGPEIGVLNAGISGNRLLGANGGVDRLDRDVLTQAGVKWVILLEGINDSSNTAFVAPQLIAAQQQIADRVHAAGLKIYGATLTPAGAAVGSLREQNRTTLNTWIRTSGVFDAVIDFDAIMRDPDNPNFPLPVYDGGDHLHPNILGYQVMGNAIDLGLFKGNDGPYPWSGVFGDVNGDGVINCADMVAARSHAGTKAGELAFAPTADMDGNGVIDLVDIKLVRVALGRTPPFSVLSCG